MISHIRKTNHTLVPGLLPAVLVMCVIAFGQTALAHYGMACNVPGVRYEGVSMSHHIESQSEIDQLAVQVRDRSDGWEQAWERLAENLWRRLEQGLRSRCFDFAGNGCTLDDIQSEMMTVWHTQVVKGTFLRGWAPGNPGGVIGYLCGKGLRTIARQCIDRVAGNHRKVNKGAIGGDAGLLAMEKTGAASADGRQRETFDADACRDVQPDAKPACCHFHPLTDAGATNIHLTAGVQLFPVIDWGHEPGPEVERGMTGFLAGVDDANWRRALQDTHDAAQQALAATERDLFEKISNDGRGVSPRRQRLLQNKIAKVRIASRIQPIDAPCLMALTNASRNTCDQYRSRYRRDFSKIVAWHDDSLVMSEVAS